MKLPFIGGLVMLLCCALLSTTNAQTTVPNGTGAGTNTAAAQAAPTNQTQSLADVARGLRKNKQAEIQMSPQDAKELFQSVDKIFEFASEDSGLPRKYPVKRQLVGATDVEKFFKEKLAKEEYSQRFARAEITMKKFGLLPRDFDLKEFLVKANGQQVAGFYDDETRTISLLNWIPRDKQEPILAHELTHALQDQNYNLKTWAKAGMRHGASGPSGKFELDDEETLIARHAVTEGQAMVVFFDYMLAPMGRTLKDTPGLVASMEDPSVTAVIDTPIMHSAPAVLRESGTFPYREGLFFEAALLERGGKRAAFTGALSNPPRSTHEVIQPDTYLRGEKLLPVRMPDLRPLVGDKYELYDSGGFGELDVRALLKQFGEKKAATELSPAWQGGAYVAFRRVLAGPPATTVTPADIALVYISRWKSTDAAQKFAKVYASGIAKRYSDVHESPAASCAGKQCPVAVFEVATNEGPVIIEQWSDNRLVISEGFDESTASQLRNTILNRGVDQNAGAMPSVELSERLQLLPAFQDFQLSLGDQILDALSARLIPTH